MKAGKTILVIDDIPLMRTMLAKYIRTLGRRLSSKRSDLEAVDVIEAESGQKALSVLESRTVDLVFLDLMMPDMDGVTFLCRRLEDPRLSRIPIVVCSALSEKADIERALALGAHSYLTKPFRLDAVEARCREALLGE